MCARKNAFSLSLSTNTLPSRQYPCRLNFESQSHSKNDKCFKRNLADAAMSHLVEMGLDVVWSERILRNVNVGFLNLNELQRGQPLKNAQLFVFL